MFAVLVEKCNAQIMGVSEETARRHLKDGVYILNIGEYTLRIIIEDATQPSARPAEPSALQTQAHISDTIASLTELPPEL